MKKPYRAALLVSGALTLGICAVMNLALIPTIETAAGGLRCFDMRFGYSFDEALAFLSALTPEGRGIYLWRQLPLDLLYPLAYGAFFLLAISGLQKRKTPLLACPVLLAAADYAENACVFLMLRGDAPSKALVAAGSAATVAKTLLMYLCFLLLLVLLLRAVIKRRTSGFRAAG